MHKFYTLQKNKIGSLLILACSLLPAIYLTFGAAKSFAAEFEIVSHSGPPTEEYVKHPILSGSGQSTPCHIKMSGEIKEGDLEKLIAIVPKVSQKLWKQKGLCLDSPGGSYPEAIRIAKVLLGKIDPLTLKDTGSSYTYDMDMWTVIDDGDECLSACAIIFMAGNFYIDAEYIGPSISRYLHINGKLGFHSPFIQIEGNEPVPTLPSELREAYADGALAVRELSNLGQKLNHGGAIEDPNVLPANLLVEMIAMEGNDFYYIDNLHKTIRNRIKLFGGDRPKNIDAQHLYNVCENVFWARQLPDENQAETAGIKSRSVTWADWKEVPSSALNFVANSRSVIISKNNLRADAADTCIIRVYKSVIQYYSDLIYLDSDKIEDYSFLDVDWYYFYNYNRQLLDLN